MELNTTKNVFKPIFLMLLALSLPVYALTQEEIESRDMARVAARLQAELKRSEKRDSIERNKGTLFVGCCTNDRQLAAYIDALAKKIEREGAKLIHRLETKEKPHKRTTVVIEIDTRSGKTIFVTIERSSGSKEFDEALLNAIYLASPFGIPPRESIENATTLAVIKAVYFQ